jgi:hypothetical protein
MLDINQFKNAQAALADDLRKLQRDRDTASLVHMSNSSSESAARIIAIDAEMAALQANLAMLQGAERAAEAQALTQDADAKRAAADQAMQASSQAMQQREALAKQIDKQSSILLNLIGEYAAASKEATVAVTTAIMTLHPVPDENTINRISLFTGPCGTGTISGALGQVCQCISKSISSHGSWSVKLNYSTSEDRTATATTAASSKLLATYLRDLAAPPVAPTHATEASTEAEVTV